MQDKLRRALDRYEEEALRAFRAALKKARARLEAALSESEAELPSEQPSSEDTLADVPIAELQRQLAEARSPSEPRNPNESLHDVSPADIAKFRDEVKKKSRRVNERKSGRVDPPAEAAKPEAQDLGELGACLDDLQALRELLDKHNFAFPKDMLSFVGKSRRIAAGLTPDERTGPKGAKVLVDCQRFVEGLGEFCLTHPRRDALSGFAASLAERWSDFLRRAGVELFPRGGADLQGLLGQEGVEARPLASDQPEGKALALLRRGFRVGGTVRQSALVCAATASDGGLSTAIARALSGMVTARPYGVGPASVDALVDLARFLREIPAADEEKRVLCARFALNRVVLQDSKNQLRSERKSLLNWLAERGYYEIKARAGDTFDESYKPSKYERRIVSSERPAGEIVRVIQVGLLNRVGVAVQKTILGVAG